METYDVIVIGGGISGLGVALEASRRGLSTLVLEKGRCSQGTSNNTLRIIHGGFRYLQNADIPRVIKSLRDQRELAQELPHTIKPLPCLMPLTRFGLKSRIPVSCAAAAFSVMMKAFRSPLPTPRIVSNSYIERHVPLLRGKAPHGALCWYDAHMLEPLQVSDYLVQTIKARGSQVQEEAPVTAVQRVTDKLFEIRLKNGNALRSRVVVNTLGPWLDLLEAPDGLRGRRTAWCKGFNVSIDRQLDPQFGIGTEGVDGRLFFCVPRGSGSAIGTGYVPYSGDPSSASVSEEELSNFIAAFNEATPNARVRREEIIAIDIGILPMTGVDARGPVVQAHETITNRENYIEVISTKYTTFRSQGKRVCDSLRC